MTITQGSGGAASIGTTTCSPGYPTVTVGQLLTLWAGWGNADNAAPSADPTGFTRIGSAVGGAGSWGSGTGPRGLTAWFRVSDGTETGTVTINNDSATSTGKTIRAQMLPWTNTTGRWATPRISSGADAAADTSWSTTAAANPGGGSGQVVHYAASLAKATSVATLSALANTWTGTTIAAPTQIASGIATGGHGVQLALFRSAVSAGLATAAPTFSMTLSASASGQGVWLVLEELPRTRARLMQQATMRASGF